MRGDPCDPIALHAIRTMVLPKLRFNDQIPVTETLEFPYEDNGRHKTYENQWGEERLAPGDDFIYPMLDAFDTLSASRGDGLYSGTVETECGPVQWTWAGIISSYAEDDVAMTSYLTMTGDCKCKLVNGKPLSIFYYSAEVTQDLRFTQNITREQAWDAVPEDDSYNPRCSLNSACCPVEEEVGDAFPPGEGEGFILEWDSAEWCTYGGGGVTIGPGGVTIGPGGTTTTPPPVPPGEGGGGNGGGTPPVPQGEGGNGGGLPPVPPGEGGNGGDDNGGGIPPVPPADDNGGDDGDDNGGHDGENGGENGGDDGDPP
ncbi:MAG: hypothetical protein HKN19_18585, partial [Halioglobus sp.]|nr:hypothetical protein [Halioglobus sp.]